MYQESNSPLPLLQAYLNVFTTGKVSSKFGNFEEKEFDNRRALISPVKKLFETFGMEAIVIWVAMLCKKRVFVYSDKLVELQAMIRSFPLLGAWHRQNFDLLRPIVGTTEAELKDLAAAGVYVAGVTDPDIAHNKKELYDLFVNIPSKEFTIAEHAKDSFILTKFHKTTADGFLKACEGATDQAVIKEIALKTKDLIDNLTKNFMTEYPDGKYITLEALQKQKLPPNADKFLFNVAQAEGMCKKS